MRRIKRAVPDRSHVAICCAVAVFCVSAASAADFAAVDANGDGLIDRAEFGDGAVGDEIFKEWDRNQDGHIDRAEWRRALQLSELESERRGQG